MARHIVLWRRHNDCDVHDYQTNSRHILWSYFKPKKSYLLGWHWPSRCNHCSAPSQNPLQYIALPVSGGHSLSHLAVAVGDFGLQRRMESERAELVNCLYILLQWLCTAVPRNLPSPRLLILCVLRAQEGQFPFYGSACAFWQEGPKLWHRHVTSSLAKSIFWFDYSSRRPMA